MGVGRFMRELACRKMLGVKVDPQIFLEAQFLRPAFGLVYVSMVEIVRTLSICYAPYYLLIILPIQKKKKKTMQQY